MIIFVGWVRGLFGPPHPPGPLLSASLVPPDNQLVKANLKTKTYLTRNQGLNAHQRNSDVLKGRQFVDLLSVTLGQNTGCLVIFQTQWSLLPIVIPISINDACGQKEGRIIVLF